MAEPEEMEEDLFADLYDGDDNPATSAPNADVPVESTAQTATAFKSHEQPGYGEEPDTGALPASFEDYSTEANHGAGNMSAVHGNGDDNSVSASHAHEGLQMKEDGKMFIGGLNWETTDQSLFDYFSQFGEVAECTVMRDGVTGRSRGFGFLTFKDPKVVNTVMVKEHFLDGKIVRTSFIDSPLSEQLALGCPRKSSRSRKRKKLRLPGAHQIDPKRAIPRDEQEKTSKIFVGGVSQEATEADFTAFFEQFGRVVDATLMMDKDTGRPRGFGFVTFDSETAVERCLEYQPLEILGKAIEVKKAQPRGKIGEEEHDARGGRGRGKFGRDDRFGSDSNQSQQQQQNPNQNQNMMGAGGMTPQMMAQYWQRMQQYFSMMQQQMAANAMGGMGMGQMNPQMMAQMQQMQMQQMKGMGGGNGNGMNMQGMNPQMQQQMMQMMNGMGGMGGQQSQQPPQGPGNRRGFSAQEQQAFEQQKYEQQIARRQHGNQGGRGSFNQNQGGPQSWEGMYDGEPQPEDGSPGSSGQVGAVRNLTPSGNRPSKSHTPQPQNNAPVNAPTGPKNPGKPGANFRGGRGGRFHPYGR